MHAPVGVTNSPSAPASKVSRPEPHRQLSTAGGGEWTSVSAGLPQSHVYVTVLREALDIDDRDPRGLYLGTSGGHLFATVNGARQWSMIADFLPRILCVKAFRLSPGTAGSISIPDAP